MIKEFPIIKLHKGATTIVEFDLTDFDFQGGYVMLTIKDAKENIIKEQRLDFKGINQVMFTDEFTANFKVGKGNYKYDLMWHIDNERFAQCLPSNIDVYSTVGGKENA